MSTLDGVLVVRNTSGAVWFWEPQEVRLKCGSLSACAIRCAAKSHESFLHGCQPCVSTSEIAVHTYFCSPNIGCRVRWYVCPE